MKLLDDCSAAVKQIPLFSLVSRVGMASGEKKAGIGRWILSALRDFGTHFFGGPMPTLRARLFRPFRGCGWTHPVGN